MILKPFFFTGKEIYMNIIKKAVRHKTFGQGEISALDDDMITVRFGAAEKKFIFPDAFREHLVLTEKTSRNYVEHIIAGIDEQARLKREKEAREAEVKAMLRSLPLSTNAQAAFAFSYNNMDKTMKEWSVSVGEYRSGYNRGQPRVPARIYPNSACLLTCRGKNEKEENRRIWGVFMPKEDFIGPECTDGIVYAHEKYRIILTEDERKDLFFWKYFKNENGGKDIKWGSVEFKYFSNMTMAGILKDIAQIKHDTDQRELCEEFMDYFRELNKLSRTRFAAENNEQPD